MTQQVYFKWLIYYNTACLIVCGCVVFLLVKPMTSRKLKDKNNDRIPTNRLLLNKKHNITDANFSSIYKWCSSFTLKHAQYAWTLFRSYIFRYTCKYHNIFVWIPIYLIFTINQSDCLRLTITHCFRLFPYIEVNY